ncbi:MAG: glycosyltransferase family 4 protein, partial [Gemmatimonadales bacterium]
MRILFLTHNFPRFAGDVSGAFLATLAQALRVRGHEVRVIAPSDQGDVGEGQLAGIPIRRVRYADPAQETLAYRGTMADAIRHPAGWRTLVSLWRAMRKAALEEITAGAHLVHAHWWVPAGLASPSSVPLVLTVHGTDGALLRKSHLARWVAAPVFRRASVVTAVSQSLAADVREFTGRVIPEQGIQPMPVDVARYRSWSSGGKGLVVVARLTAQKRIGMALRALAELPEDIHLTIVGEGPERERLEAL